MPALMGEGEPIIPPVSMPVKQQTFRPAAERCTVDALMRSNGPEVASPGPSNWLIPVPTCLRVPCLRAACLPARPSSVRVALAGGSGSSSPGCRVAT